MTDQAAPGSEVIPIPLGHVNSFLIRDIRALLDKHPATIYAGHGGPFSRELVEALLR